MLTGLLPPPPDTVQVAADGQKKLQDGALPQLETRLQRLPVHVRHADGTGPRGPLQLAKNGGFRWSIRAAASEELCFVASADGQVTRSPV